MSPYLQGLVSSLICLTKPDVLGAVMSLVCCVRQKRGAALMRSLHASTRKSLASVRPEDGGASVRQSLEELPSGHSVDLEIITPRSIVQEADPKEPLAGVVEEAPTRK